MGNIEIGVILEVRRVEVEDASWLRKRNDRSRINVAELDAIKKVVSLTLRWEPVRIRNSK